MTEVRIYASLEHYWTHIQPVAEALRSSTTAVLGGIHAPEGRRWGVPLPRDRTEGLWLGASGADVKRLGAGVRVVYLEHGAGQSYHGDPRAATSISYAGGDGLEQVVLFLCPNESVAARWRARYPATPAAVVGSPRLDRMHRTIDTWIPTVPTTVAITFHWPNTLCPETQWALPHYRTHLPALRDAIRAAGGELIGHGHPRVWRQLRREWARLGIRAVETLAEVFDQADLLVADNSSAGPEFASLGRPVVWLSAPWYRREVVHGGRFWEWVEGMPHVEEAADLVPTVLAVLADPSRWEPGRAAMVASAYSACDGHAAERAAEAIMELAAQGG